MVFIASCSISIAFCRIAQFSLCFISSSTVSTTTFPWTGEFDANTYTHSKDTEYILLSLRLVMPPLLFATLQWPFTTLVHKILPTAMANAGICGAFTFYILYDCMHYGYV
jgi:sterol desaturase/sphingolipid hydroxylase (fatty acid hydroxylase superfamily)